MQPRPEHRLDFVRSIPFFLIHLAAVAGVFWLGWSWSGLGLAVALYAVRMFGVTGAYHRMSDQPGDVHSVLHDGFWWSHVGWIVSPDYHDADYSKVKDLARYPELR